jgi:hypothetical protein
MDEGKAQTRIRLSMGSGRRTRDRRMGPLATRPSGSRKQAWAELPTRQQHLTYLTFSLQRRKASSLCLLEQTQQVGCPEGGPIRSSRRLGLEMMSEQLVCYDTLMLSVDCFVGRSPSRHLSEISRTPPYRLPPRYHATIHGVLTAPRTASL